MLKGFGDMMKQAQAMQGDLQKMQEDMLKEEITGQSGGGMVTVVLNGKYAAKRVSIDDSLVGDDKDMLEDLVTAAINDAVQKVERVTQEKYAGALGGIQLPPGMKLPF
jgi:nucleoid-associated protein EbfC